MILGNGFQHEYKLMIRVNNETREAMSDPASQKLY